MGQYEKIYTLSINSNFMYHPDFQQSNPIAEKRKEETLNPEKDFLTRIQDQALETLQKDPTYAELLDGKEEEDIKSLLKEIASENKELWEVSMAHQSDIEGTEGVRAADLVRQAVKRLSN